MPNSKADVTSCSIINGISMAVEALSELTELQKRNGSLRHGGDGLLRSDLFSAAISNMKYEVLSEKERILSASHAKICKKHMIRHDANSLKRKKVFLIFIVLHLNPYEFICDRNLNFRGFCFDACQFIS